MYIGTNVLAKQFKTKSRRLKKETESEIIIISLNIASVVDFIQWFLKINIIHIGPIYTYTLTIQKLLFSSIDNFFLSRLKGNNIMLKNLSCTCMCPSSCTNKQTKLQFNSL